MQTYPRISLNVGKLGETIPTINLPAGITCNPETPCFKGCYARKGNFTYKNVQKSLQKNLEAYLQNPEGFFSIIDAILQNIPYKFFRWHSSGDIVDCRYLEFMCKLARKHKATKFLCFTKKYVLVNEFFYSHRKPKNLIIVFSNWGDWKCENPHNFPTAYVDLGKTEIPQNANKCNRFCGACANTKFSCWNLQKGEAVCFKKH